MFVFHSYAHFGFTTGTIIANSLQASHGSLVFARLQQDRDHGLIISVAVLNISGILTLA